MAPSTPVQCPLCGWTGSVSDVQSGQNPTCPSCDHDLGDVT
jgi:uncharacterized paraquat-inducible protein A